EIEWDGLRGKAEKRNSSAAADDVERGAYGIGMASHFEDHVDAEAYGFFGDDGTNVFFGGVERVVGFHFRREFAAVLIDFNGEDGGRAHSSRHRDREQANGAATGNGYSLRSDFTGKHGVYGVAQR